jgi:hypothetical protein
MPRKFSGAYARIQLVCAGLRAEIVALKVGQRWYPLAEYELGRVISSADTIIDLTGALPDDLRCEVAGGAP